METKDIKMAVCEALINMLYNNIICDYGNESFEGWCEDGAVFETSHPNADRAFIEECEKLMKEIAPLIDKLTYNYFASL